MFNQVERVVSESKNCFRYFHLHITFGPEYTPKLRSTTIGLPYPDGRLFKQNLTTGIFVSENCFLKMLDEFKNTNNKQILGVKVEGIKKIVELHKLPYFCYIEDHFKEKLTAEKWKELEIKIPKKFNLSYSFKNNAILGAYREYSPCARNLYTRETTHVCNPENCYTEWEGEICIYEKWFENIETPWLSLSITDQLKILKINLKKRQENKQQQYKHLL